jgi:subtilisin family serine protease
MIRKFLLVMVIVSLVSVNMVFGERWILDSKNDVLAPDLEETVKLAGGTLISTMDEVGIAVAEFATREEAGAMEAHGFVVIPDLYLDWVGSDGLFEYAGSEASADLGSGSAAEAGWYFRQWHIPAIQANKAWETGVLGAGARVAVVDSGIWYHHPDLYDNIDFASSTTFVEGTTDFIDTDGHGTHVAGIIAASGTVRARGIAPRATLIAIKVSEGGGGYFSWIIAGIDHAIKVNADIVNVSMGNYLSKNGNKPYYNASVISWIRKMYTKVITKAAGKGSLVIFSGGNNGLDRDRTGDLIHVPGECGNGINVAATGAMGGKDFDRIASYSDYGNSLVWVAAPGGDYPLYPANGWWYDLIYSTSPGGWVWMTGTSQAAPMVSGVAALIVSKYGSMSPGKLKNHIANTADDLGKPGQDKYYGFGRVNAYKAVTK